jgi:hypothetical protein
MVDRRGMINENSVFIVAWRVFLAGVGHEFAVAFDATTLDAAPSSPHC